MKVSIGQWTDKGRKDLNQDFHGVVIPREPQLSTKGVAIAIADGISASDVSQIASQAAVTGFLEDYYCTSDAWSVKTSVERVLVATNSWLYSQTQQSQGRFDKDRGYVCTLSAMVCKSTTAHVFHVGDTRIYRLHPHALEQLTTDHRIYVAPGQSYLGRALGVNGQLEIDYRTFPLEAGDVFMLATDGVYEFADAAFVTATVAAHPQDLDRAARLIGDYALAQGSRDNLTIQLLRIDELARPEAGELVQQMAGLPFPPILEARMDFDGFKIVREVRGSSRSHVYLAVDGENGQLVIVKTPSIDLQDDRGYVERFLMEEWVARRISSAHVLKPCAPTRKRNWLYLVTEYIDGCTLAQWMLDHPMPELETVRGLIEQLARGVRAFHRLEMLHQDLRPDNVMIDRTGTVKIIDFGATRVAGIDDIDGGAPDLRIPGAAAYAAPEFFVGGEGSPQSDIYSLGVIAYQMLTGRLPYGMDVPKIRTPDEQRRLRYISMLDFDPDIPLWVDETVRKAVHPQPHKRYQDVDEFVFDLRHPNRALAVNARRPLIERNPVVFWKSVSAGLLAALVGVLAWSLGLRG
jgi:serine/threonine protein phosphatase PrpC